MGNQHSEHGSLVIRDTHVLNTIVMIPAGVVVLALAQMIKSQLTAGSPSLGSLLQLEKHVTTVVVVVEVMNIVDD